VLARERIKDAPDNPVFLISGIRLDTEFDLPDIRILKIAGYHGSSWIRNTGFVL
jgi:hypothetical protein